jgi:hypothetical protein
MTKKKKNYNEKAPYLVKKARVKNNRPMCPKCSKCLDKSFCYHRRNLKLMNKCPDCHNCSDNKHCNKLYISEKYSVTIVVGVDEETGIPIETQRKESQKYVDSVKMLLGDSINEYTREEKSLNP